MTSSNTFKKQVRALADERGIKYTEARRLLLDAAGALIDDIEAVGQEPTSDTILSIHRETDSRGSLPMPFFVHRNGMIRRQDFWRGEAYFLIGFEDPKAAAASPDGRDITVTRDEFLADPQRVIGMQAVLMNRQRGWNTWDGRIETVREQDVTLAAPERAVLRVTIPGGGHDVTSMEIPVGHLLELLTPADLADGEKTGWTDCDATDELLWMASLSHGAAGTAQEALDDLDRDDYTLSVTGPAVGKPSSDPDTEG